MGGRWGSNGILKAIPAVAAIGSQHQDRRGLIRRWFKMLTGLPNQWKKKSVSRSIHNATTYVEQGKEYSSGRQTHSPE
jgi:hypothetical protein